MSHPEKRESPRAQVYVDALPKTLRAVVLAGCGPPMYAGVESGFVLWPDASPPVRV
jgi:hypothetical protein